MGERLFNTLVATWNFNKYSDDIILRSHLLSMDRELIRLGYFPYQLYEKSAADPAVVMTLVRRFPLRLQFASAELRADRDIVFTAVSGNGAALEFASVELRADKDIVFTAVSGNGSALKFVDSYLQDDKDVVFTAMRSHSRVSTNASNPMYWASNRLKRNREFMDKVGEIDQNRKGLYKAIWLNFQIEQYENENSDY